MWIVDDILDSLLPGGSGRRDRKLERLLAEGETLPAVIDGIHVESDGDRGEKHLYSVRATGPTGPFRATVRQQLRPGSDRVRLGMAAKIRHRDGDIAIDWPATLRDLGVDVPQDTSIIRIKTLKTPKEPGITDTRADFAGDRKRLERGRRTEATVVAAEPVEVFGMPSENVHLELRIEDEGGRVVRTPRALVPRYATDLVAVGTRLPIAIDPKKPDKISVDWVLAATRAAGR